MIGEGGHGGQRGSPVGADDRYGRALVTILASLVMTALLPDTPFGRLLLAVVLSGTLLLVYLVSAVGRRALRLAAALALVGVVVSAVLALHPLAGPADDGTLRLVLFAYMAAGPWVVGRRLLQHEVITKATVAGALSLYLLVGQAYAGLYPLIAALTRHPFFAQRAATVPTDYLYFSLITLTTVGYGDFTAASDVGRVVAATEALVGQLYLVTVVALVVGNIGRERSSQSREDG